MVYPVGAALLGAYYLDATIALRDERTGEAAKRVVRASVVYLPLLLVLVLASRRVATELGDWATIDIGPFERAYCDLVREVWAKVPIGWEHGLVVRQDTPAGHPCASK